MDSTNSAAGTAPTGLPTISVRDPHDVEENKDLAAFSYLWIMSVIVYFAKRKSPFIRFHARQAMVLFFLSILLFFIPVAGKFLEIIVLACMVFGFLNAAQGNWKDVPLVGPVSRGESGLRDTWKDIVHGILKFFHKGKDVVIEERSAIMNPARAEKQPDAIPPPLSNIQ